MLQYDKINETTEMSLLLGRKKREISSSSSFSFAGFRMGLSAENLLYRREGTAD